MASMNTTKDYHVRTPIDLMQEFTICESFAELASPYMVCLEHPRPYGALIGDHLSRLGMLNRGARIMEVGGGYGSLMHGLLTAYADHIARVFMVDLSRSLLERQKRRLNAWAERLAFIRGDIHELIDAVAGIDLLIMNEVIGDLDTWTDLDPGALPPEVARLVETYGLEIPAQRPFNFNIGAVLLVEALCRTGIPVFLSEHSCDPLFPEDMDYLATGLSLDGFPREIRLGGHSEFTIRFSHLLAVAQAFGRHTCSGALLDLVGVKRTPGMRFIFQSRACAHENQEIIFELLDHIREYRWLMIV